MTIISLNSIAMKMPAAGQSVRMACWEEEPVDLIQGNESVAPLKKAV
jgi:hypothetical protein